MPTHIKPPVSYTAKVDFERIIRERTKRLETIVAGIVALNILVFFLALLSFVIKYW